MSPLVPVGRLVLGAWLLVDGLGYYAGLVPAPTGHTPAAVQLMTAAVHGGLLDVVMGMQAVTGALLVVGLFVPAALAVVMPIATCGAYWAVILDQQPLGALLALVFLALTGFLMLAHLENYRGVLQRRALAIGEA